MDGNMSTVFLYQLMALRGGTGHGTLYSQGGGGRHRDTGLSGVCYCIECVLFPSKESKEASVRPPSISVTALALPLLDTAVCSLQAHQFGRAPPKFYLWALKFECHVIFMYHKILF